MQKHKSSLFLPTKKPRTKRTNIFLRLVESQKRVAELEATNGKSALQHVKPNQLQSYDLRNQVNEWIEKGNHLKHPHKVFVFVMPKLDHEVAVLWDQENEYGIAVSASVLMANPYGEDGVILLGRGASKKPSVAESKKWASEFYNKALGA